MSGDIDAGPSGAFDAGPSGAFDAGPSGAFDAGPSGAFDAGPSGAFDAGPSGAFDAWADIYAPWCASAPVSAQNLPFYVARYLETRGPVVELGVGDGRIAVEAARRGKALVGVDDSREMLARCRRRAEEAGVADLLTLLQADMRAFEPPEPPALVSIPFHSIGCLVTLDAKRACLARVHEVLRPGGRLVLDHFVFDPAYASGPPTPQLRGDYRDPETGRETLLWAVTRNDLESQTMHVIAWTDELDLHRDLARRRHRRLDFSWLHPHQTRELLEGAGFEIESLHGGFAGEPFDDRSPEKVWTARKPD